MNNDTKTSPQTVEPAAADQQQINDSRRRFAKSVAGSGVILTLASKPVMGANYWCTGSGGMSGNTSSHGPQVSCIACSPGYWKSSPENWPAGYYPYKICDIFGNTVHNPTKFAEPDKFGSCASGNDKTMMWVMQNQNGSRDWHACAALLNAAKAAQLGLTSAYTEYEIKTMYRNGAPASTFSSTWEGGLHNCPLPNTNTSTYEVESKPFCKLISSSGEETSKTNPACSSTSSKKS